MKNIVRQLWKEEGAQSLAEYTLLIAVIALLLSATFPALVALLVAPYMRGMNCANAPFAGLC